MAEAFDPAGSDPQQPKIEKGTGKPPRRMGRVKKWLLWIAAALFVLLIVIGVAATVLLRRAEPMMRAALINALQQRFHARVELDDMHVSIVDGFQVEAGGLRIWLPDEDRAMLEEAGGDATLWRNEPWISAANMRFHASWRIVPGKPIVLSVIHIDGVRVLLPPKADRPHVSLPEAPKPMQQPSPGASTSPGMANPSATTQNPAPQSPPRFFAMPRVEVRRIECNEAELVIERKFDPAKPNRSPLDFQLRKITLVPDGHGGPIAFDVDMINAKPVGVIHTIGHFGPWVTGDPGALPVEGTYTFDHADLGTIKGIEGILSSTGKYAGTLRRIETDGQTRTPDFRLERVSQKSGVLLTTNFHAIVDGTNGNTDLEPVDAMLGHTHILATGQVLRADDGKGHDIQLKVKIDRGRIEDILHISADGDRPFLTGNLALDTGFHLPPGKESVWDKLQLNGDFHLTDSRFSKPEMQDKIEELSLRGQGKPKEVKTIDPATIASEVQGHFKLDSGTLQLPDLDYKVPGAEIVAHGAYGLQDGSLAFDGDAKLDASLSQIVGGWKGFLLKPADRYLRKNGAGTDVPIHITGTRKDPKFGIDRSRLGKEDDPQKPGTQ